MMRRIIELRTPKQQFAFFMCTMVPIECKSHMVRLHLDVTMIKVLNYDIPIVRPSLVLMLNTRIEL